MNYEIFILVPPLGKLSQIWLVTSLNLIGCESQQSDWTRHSGEWYVILHKVKLFQTVTY